MPDEPTPVSPTPPPATITDEQKKKIEAWFKKHQPIGGVVCPICHHKNWTILVDFLAPPTFHGGAMVLGGNSYPHFVLVCTTCGNSQFINAIAAGIITPTGGSSS